jgi:hypothetical protein
VLLCYVISVLLAFDHKHNSTELDSILDTYHKHNSTELGSILDAYHKHNRTELGSSLDTYHKHNSRLDRYYELTSEIIGQW